MSALSTDSGLTFLTETAIVHRPFGSGTPLNAGIAGRLVADSAGLSTTHALQWTHRLELSAGADIRDACSRAAGSNALTYADGDEVRIDDVRYVVVWVERVNQGTMHERTRAYLMRH